MKTAVLFPGQGSQYVGMAEEFIKTDSMYQDLVAEAEEICGFALRPLMENGPLEELTRNSRVQPAITVTNMICWQALKKELGPQAISCFAGHSLGEYSALYASGVITATDCLRLVAKRGALMEREGERTPGGMRAVLGLFIEEIEAVLEQYSGSDCITVANHNTPQQIVIAGTMEALDAVCPVLEERGAKVIALNVSVANHSPLVSGAVPDFLQFMNEITFHTPELPVYFNVTGTTLSDPQEIKETMARQITSRVRWCELIGAMVADGVTSVVEVGPKTVLKGMMRKIVPKKKGVQALQCDTPEGLACCIAKLS